jgi:hypothetical protein
MLEEYIPNAFRSSLMNIDPGRLSTPYTGYSLIKRLSQPDFKMGLTGNHIALWPSHGYYFDQRTDRWRWQRARLWQTVEDIFPWSITSSYLIPMLENSGAVVLLPRERDTQIHEVIVDNDIRHGASRIITDGIGIWDSLEYKGFMDFDTLFPGQNPFESGTSMALHTFPGDSSTLTYIPDIPQNGEYAVYVSWQKTRECLPQVLYEVKYSGGEELFYVNQCMGSGTWNYLGTFQFRRGMDGYVKLSGGDTTGIISADAVRFGGGMGKVARKNQLSGKPRWMEGARYYLQSAGMPDSITFNLHRDTNDYNDDYMSRPEWVNYLIGPAKPQYNDKYNNGLAIPVDLALAFHTDAGITANDSVIGTLGIYSTVRNGGIFPDGKSKLASRDLTDIVQTQVVEDLRMQINPDWTRRALWDREYSEAWRPIVPSMLLELLSHQNLTDMKYGLDPRFKFTAARAIYKGILRYLAASQEKEVVIQPLPPDHMAIDWIEGRTIKVSWQMVEDSLEITAKPDGYKIYQKTEDMGFATGIPVKDNFIVIELPEWNTIYSFRVTALNRGGESFPGETLSVSLSQSSTKPVLIVNAFDRVSGPAFFERADMAGIAWWEDEGVQHGTDFSLSGFQYNFNRNSEWIDDDSQGWGASSADMEAIPVMGNTFAFPLIHGKALRDAGYSFVSISDEVFESLDFNMSRYQVADIIFGEERGTESFLKTQDKQFRVFTPEFMHAIEKFTASGGNVFISGAYIGTDMVENHDSVAVDFAAEVLHFEWRTNHATKIGLVNATHQSSPFFPGYLQFNTGFNSPMYRVESPDAIEPSGRSAFRIYRYASGNATAGIAFAGEYRTVVLGFPFESIIDASQRTELMKGILKFFADAPK